MGGGCLKKLGNIFSLTLRLNAFLHTQCSSHPEEMLAETFTRLIGHGAEEVG